MTRIVQLNDAQWELFEALRRLQTPAQIMAALGVNRSRVTNLATQLVELGVIRRRGDLPAKSRWTPEQYPWEPTAGVIVSYKPLLPPKARIRADYPVTSERDWTVAPIRHATWPPSWSAQALVPLRPDGKSPKHGLPTHRVLLLDNLTTGDGWETRVERGRIWRETDTWDLLSTQGHMNQVTESEQEAITQLIAAVLGIDALMDLSTRRTQ